MGPNGYPYLRHSTEAGDLVAKVAPFRQANGPGVGTTIEQARERLPGDLAGLEDLVAVTVSPMPLPKLQCFSTGAGAREDQFFHDYGWPDEAPEGRACAAGLDDTL